MLGDISSVIYGDEPTSQENAKALVAALRKQQFMGLLADVMSGNEKGVGEAMTKNAGQEQQMLAHAQEQRFRIDETKQHHEDMRKYYEAIAGIRQQGADAATTNADTAAKKAGSLKVTNTPSGKTMTVNPLTGATQVIDDLDVDPTTGAKIRPTGRGGGGGPSDKELKEFEKAMNPETAGRGKNVAKYAAQLNLAKKARSLVIDPATGELYDNVPPQFVHEIATTMAALATQGGQPTESTIHNFVPHDIGMDAANLEQYLTNMPRDAGQKEFLKKYLESMNNETRVNREALRNAQLSTMTGYPGIRKNRPDDWKRVVGKYFKPDFIDENYNYKPPAPVEIRKVGSRKIAKYPDGSLEEID